jgi:ABC-type multidrug transport system permease subunit
VPWPSAVRVTMTFVSSLTSVSSHSSSIHCSMNDGKGIFYGVFLCSVLLPLFMYVQL